MAGITDILATSLVVTGADQYANQLRRASYSVKYLQNSIEDLNKTQTIHPGGGTGGIMDTLGLVGPGKWIALTAGITAVGTATASTGVKFEDLQARLATVAGSESGGRAFMDWVTRFAKDTPYELDEVTSALIRMKNYGLDPLNGEMKTIGDFGAVMGRNMRDTVEAVTDAMMGEWERMKEYGLKRELLEQWMRKRGMVVPFDKQGRITDQQGLKQGLFAYMEERGSGAMERRMQTLGGKLSNFKDSMTTTFAGLAVGLSPLFKGALDLGISFFEALKDILTPLAPVLFIISTGIGYVAKGLGIVFSVAGTLVKVVLGLLVVGFKGWGIVIGDLWGHMKNFGGWLKDSFVGTIIKRLGEGITWVAGIIKRFLEWLDKSLKGIFNLPGAERTGATLVESFVVAAQQAMKGVAGMREQYAGMLGDVRSLADKMNLSTRQRGALIALEVTQLQKSANAYLAMADALKGSKDADDKKDRMDYLQKAWGLRKSILELALQERDVDRERREVLGGGALAQAGVKQYEVWKKIRGNLARSVESPRFNVKVDVEGEQGLEGFVRQVAEQIMGQMLEFVDRSGQKEFSGVWSWN